MKNTENFNLKKPDISDFYNINDFNENMDVIDEEMKGIQESISNVPNVTTNDQTPTYTKASSLSELVSGEKLSVAFGKLAKAVSDLISHIGNKSNPHSVTAAQVGLGNVSNVTTNNQTPTYTKASTLTALISGEKLSVAFGKLAKAVSDLISHIGNKSNPHNVTASQIPEIGVLQSRPVNNNLLINSNFASPVNQRGETGRSDEGYWIDRWTKDGVVTTTIGVGYIQVSHNTDGNSWFSLSQYVEGSLLGKTLTFSVKEYGGDIVSVTATIPKSVPSTVQTVSTDSVNFSAGISTGMTGLTRGFIKVPEGKTVKLEWAKLELGDTPTPYVARTYDEELLLCQRYYQILFSRDAQLSQLSTGAMRFSKEFGFPMRITPTIDFSECAVDKSMVKQTGFTFSAYASSDRYVVVNCTKASHGLTYANYLGLSGNIYLDAEI